MTESHLHLFLEYGILLRGIFVVGLGFFERCTGVFLNSCFNSMYNRIFQAIFLKKEPDSYSLHSVRQNLAAEIALE